MKKIFIALMFIVMMYNISYANEGNIQFGDNYYSIYGSISNLKLYINTLYYNGDTKLAVINAMTLCKEKELAINTIIQGIKSVDNGTSLIILLAECDKVETTEDGALIKMDSENGNILNSIVFDLCPMSMAIDEQNTYAYVTTGIRHDIDGKLLKISLDNFQIEREIQFGRTSDSMALTNDGEKLYVKSQEYLGAIEGYDDNFYVSIFDTSDLSLIGHIPISFLHSNLIMGYDERLYIANRTAVAWEPSILVIDTETDHIVETINPACGGIGFMAIDKVNRKLYCTTFPQTYHDLETDEWYHQASNLILELDLQDYSHRLITVGDSEYWEIAIVNINGNCRLFCGENEGPKIYYKDVGD